MADVDREPTEFGRLVKRYREARNMSQDRLAKLIGTTDGYISQIESGKRGRRPDRDLVIGIAQALGAPAIELLRSSGKLREGDELLDGRPTFEAFVMGDPSLRIDQKRILVDLYSSFVGRSAG